MTDETTDETEAAQTRVKVVYCGGCNPNIDRAAVAAGLPVGPSAARSPHTVYLNGCPRACASEHLLVIDDRGDGSAQADASDDAAAVVVAGELVDGVPTPAADLAAAVTRKLKE